MRRRFSNQAMRSRRRTTSPTMVSAGGCTAAARARAAMSPIVPTTTRWRAVVPRSTTATGSVGGRPAATSRSMTASRRETLM